MAISYIMHTDADNIELKAALDQLPLNLLCDAVETDVAFREDRLLGLGVRSGHGAWSRCTQRECASREGGRSKSIGQGI